LRCGLAVIKISEVPAASLHKNINIPLQGDSPCGQAANFVWRRQHHVTLRWQLTDMPCTAPYWVISRDCVLWRKT